MVVDALLWPASIFFDASRLRFRDLLQVQIRKVPARPSGKKKKRHNDYPITCKLCTYNKNSNRINIFIDSLKFLAPKMPTDGSLSQLRVIFKRDFNIMFKLVRQRYPAQSSLPGRKYFSSAASASGNSAEYRIINYQHGGKISGNRDWIRVFSLTLETFWLLSQTWIITKQLINYLAINLFSELIFN